MVDIVSRAQWGARPPLDPKAVIHVPWSARAGFAVHYSQGSPTSTPRDLQAYAQNSLGYNDTHYNLFVDRRGVAYEGRGWLVVAAHAGGHNTAWIGVCFIGRDSDVTDAAKATIRALYDDACRMSGRTLRFSGHGQLPEQNTDCPGNNLRTWVAAGMPYPNGTGDDMDAGQDAALKALFWMPDEVTIDAGNGVVRPVPVPLTHAFKAVHRELAEIKARPAVDPEAVAAALAGNPAFVDALAAAVVDSIGARLQP